MNDIIKLNVGGT